jgi:hypothetical protein
MRNAAKHRSLRRIPTNSHVDLLGNDDSFRDNCGTWRAVGKPRIDSDPKTSKSVPPIRIQNSKIPSSKVLRNYRIYVLTSCVGIYLADKLEVNIR